MLEGVLVQIVLYWYILVRWWYTRLSLAKNHGTFQSFSEKRNRIELLLISLRVNLNREIPKDTSLGIFFYACIEDKGNNHPCSPPARSIKLFILMMLTNEQRAENLAPEPSRHPN